MHSHTHTDRHTHTHTHTHILSLPLPLNLTSHVHAHTQHTHFFHIIFFPVKLCTVRSIKHNCSSKLGHCTYTEVLYQYTKRTSLMGRSGICGCTGFAHLLRYFLHAQISICLYLLQSNSPM